MSKQLASILYFVLMAAIIVAVDFTFLKNHFRERLIANISIVIIFAAFYLRFFKR